MSIFIPKKIVTGYQKRKDTYTGKLAYIVYKDDKDKLRKEKSFYGWIDEELPIDEFENTPTSGFVLNKKVGGSCSHWNNRQTYIRIYDPRGMEFEITVENLIYILENTTSTKGKGLEGEFVYGWDTKELVLIPTSSPDYKELKEISDAINNNTTIKAKDLKVGASYLTKDKKEYIYMGKFDRYDENGLLKGKEHFFAYSNINDYYRKENKYYNFASFKSISKKIISVINDNCVSNYDEIFKEMEYKSIYSPVDYDNAKYIPYSFEEFNKKIEGGKADYIAFYDKNGEYFNLRSDTSNNAYKLYKYIPNTFNELLYSIDITDNMVEEFLESFKPCYKLLYLENNKLYREWR